MITELDRTILLILEIAEIISITILIRVLMDYADVIPREARP
jgi:hypothetical protein